MATRREEHFVLARHEPKKIEMRKFNIYINIDIKLHLKYNV